MKYVFGPVPSRRLGLSLGIDLVPFKTCTFNCLYCECGPTTNLTLLRKEYVPTEEVIKELKRVLSTSPDLDWVTFSGSGEPTLHTGIGKIIEFLKNSFDYPVAVLTNGSLLFLPEVRRALLRADLVIPSLDAPDAETFKRINMPVAGISFEKYVEGLKSFCKEFKGRVWLEIMFVKGVNDSEEVLNRFKNILKEIKVEKIQIGTIERPPAYRVFPVSSEFLQKAADVLRAEIIGAPTDEVFQRAPLVETIKRRPLTLSQIVQITGMSKTEVIKQLQWLQRKGIVEVVRHGGEVFYKYAGS